MNAASHADDGPQSSEEGSGMHSPVLYGPGASTTGDSFRYQHDPTLEHPSTGSGGNAPPPPPPGTSSSSAVAYHEYSLAAPPPHAQIVLERSSAHPHHPHHPHHLSTSQSHHSHSQQHHGHGGGGGGGGGGQHQHHLPPPPPHHHSPYTSGPPSQHYLPPVPSPPHHRGGGGGGGGGGQPQHHLAIDRLDIHSPGPGSNGGGHGVDWYGQRMPSQQQQEYSRGVPVGGMGGPVVDTRGGGGHGNGAGQVDTQSNGGGSPAPASTERRKEASNVVIACRQCRARKIRCDSTRPGCNNCARRNNQCEYDAVPKRRGPDKRPGTRQRSCKKRPPPDSNANSSPQQGSANSATLPATATTTTGQGQQPPTKRKRTTANSSASQAAMSGNQGDTKEGVAQQQQQGVGQGMYQYAPPPPAGELRLSSSEGYGHQVKLEHSPTYRRDLTYDPYAKSPSSTSYTRHLGLVDPSSPYASVDSMGMGRGLGMGPMDPRGMDPMARGMGAMEGMPRNISLQQMNAVIAEQLNANWGRLLKANPVPVIMQEIIFVVNGTGHYLSFINVENLERMLCSEQFTMRVHPGFVWAALALANLMRSSTYGRGQQGLGVAMALFAEAKSALEIAWADASYAYGALIIALFESSAHPHYSHARALNALVELDDYIHQMHLTMQDAHHPEVSGYEGVPVIFYPPERETLDHHKGCGCSSLASASASSSHGHSGVSGVDLYGGGPGAVGGAAGRTYIPPWETTWTLDQIRAEEVRRMCWSALSLVSAFLAQAATDNRRMPVFHLSDPRQYRLLFPGETTDRHAQAFNYPDGLTAKESVWALYCRSMLLWNYANRFRNLEGTEDEGVSDEVTEVMSEAGVIEESLDMHKCGLDGMLMFTTREYTHNIRMLGTQALRVLQGYPDRSSIRSPGSASGAAPSLPPPPSPLYFKRKHLEDWVNHQEKIVRQVLVVCANLGAPEGVQVTERPFRVQWFFNGLATALQLWGYDRSLDEALHLGKKFLQIVDTMNYLWDCPENRAEAAQLRSRLTEACRMSGVEAPYSPRQMSLR